MPASTRRPARARVPLEERFSYRCSLISSKVTRFLAPMWAEKYGLTVITWRVMAVIGRYGPVSAKEVAAHTSTDAFHVFRAIEQLVERGYVQRDVDEKDRRRVSLRLSRSGALAHRKIEAVINRVESELLSALRPEERQVLQAALARLDERCQALQDEGLSWEDFAA